MANYNKPTSCKSDKNKTYKTAGLVILVLLVIALALILFRSCGADTPTVDDPVNSGLVYDDGAVVGELHPIC